MAFSNRLANRLANVASPEMGVFIVPTLGPGVVSDVPPSAPQPSCPQTAHIGSTPAGQFLSAGPWLRHQCRALPHVALTLPFLLRSTLLSSNSRLASNRSLSVGLFIIFPRITSLTHGYWKESLCFLYERCRLLTPSSKALRLLLCILMVFPTPMLETPQ